MINKITDFGYNFQIKTIVCLMKDVKFIEQIHDILDEKHFDNEAIKWIIKNCREYYDEYKKNITLDVFKIKTNEVQNDILKTTVVDTLREVYKHLDASDLEFVQDKALDFFKNQALKNAIMSSVEILEQKGDFDQIKVLIDDAMKAGTERNLGHDYIEDFEIRYSELARETIPTDWDVINELMQGGLGKGELGVIVAPAGIGKCIGGDTEIEIQYEDIGFNITNELVLWFKPWDIIHVNDDLQLTAYDVSVLLSPAGIGKTS